MKKTAILLITILLFFISCKKNESEKIDSQPSFDVFKEKISIDDLIKNQKLNYISYYKKYNDNNLYTGNAIINSSDDTPEYSYTIWYKKNKIVEISITKPDFEDGGLREDYYFKSIGNVFCYQYLNISYPNGIGGNRATFFLNDDNQIIKENYETKYNEVFKNIDKKNFIQQNSNEKIVFNKNLNEVLKFYGLEESLDKINQASSEGNVEDENIKPLDEIQLTLTDATIKKAKIYLGEPDKYEYGFGDVSKGFAIYFNKVKNPQGQPEHLILFLRSDGYSWGNNAKIEEIYSVNDNQKACFGIHCIEIRNHKIHTNALDLVYDKGYEKL